MLAAPEAGTEAPVHAKCCVEGGGPLRFEVFFILFPDLFLEIHWKSL